MKIIKLLTLIFICFQIAVAHSETRGLMVKSVASVDPVVNGKYRALIIGNNNYKDLSGQWKPLNTAASDAKSVAKLLKTEYGFNDINVLLDANRSDVLKALTTLEEKTGQDDSVLVYYAGHGYLDDTSSRGYWIPVDANSSDPSTYLRNSTIRDEMSIISSKAKHTLLISDSCFSGSLLRRGGSPAVPSNTPSQYYKKVANKKSVQIMAAGGIEYVDDDYRKSGHSPFTYFLLNELKHNDKQLITASEVSSNVVKAVANNVSQLPESGVLQGAGDELGEFIFVRVKLDVAVEGVPKEKIKVIVDVNPVDENVVIKKQVKIDEPEPEIRSDLSSMPLPTL